MHLKPALAPALQDVWGHRRGTCHGRAGSTSRRTTRSALAELDLRAKSVDLVASVSTAPAVVPVTTTADQAVQVCSDCASVNAVRAGGLSGSSPLGIMRCPKHLRDHEKALMLTR